MLKENARRETQLRYEAVLDHIAEGIIFFDREASSFSFNPCALRILELAAPVEQPFTLASLNALFEVSTLEGVPITGELLPWARAMRGESARGIELRLRRAGQEWERECAISCFNVTYGSRRALAFMTIIDIGERMAATRTLRASEAHLRNAQRIAKIGSWEWDVDSDVLHCSDALHALLGLDHGKRFDGSYQEFLKFVHPSDRGKVERARSAAVAGLAPFDIEHRLVRADGSTVHVHQRGDLVCDSQRRPLRLCGTAQDVSDRRRAADSLRYANEATTRAETSDRRKSDFLATVSHELRTPLNSIIGFVALLLQGLPGPLNAEQTKQLGIVRASAQHLLALINDVLDLASIEAGQFELHREQFDLRTMLEHLIETVEPLATEKGLQLTLVADAQLGSLLSDRRRVEQVLLNLLNNAVKFTERGAVTLTAETVGAAEPQLRLRVADTGIGIAAADLESVFQPFRQLDADIGRRREGTGLGLAISRRLAQHLNGSIQAASARGVGSSFTFTLPMLRGASASSAAP